MKIIKDLSYHTKHTKKNAYAIEIHWAYTTLLIHN